MRTFFLYMIELYVFLWYACSVSWVFRSTHTNAKSFLLHRKMFVLFYAYSLIERAIAELHAVYVQHKACEHFFYIWAKTYCAVSVLGHRASIQNAISYCIRSTNTNADSFLLLYRKMFVLFLCMSAWVNFKTMALRNDVTLILFLFSFAHFTASHQLCISYIHKNSL